MGIREGAASYARAHGRETSKPDLAGLAATKIGLGKVRHMAQSGNQEAKQVLRDLKAAEVERQAAYDA